jgi:hypothetical protein
VTSPIPSISALVALPVEPALEPALPAERRVLRLRQDQSADSETLVVVLRKAESTLDGTARAPQDDTEFRGGLRMISLVMMLTVSISTGNDLNAACKSTDPLETVACVSYIKGVLDGAGVDRIIGKVPPAWCSRPEVTNGQIRDVVLKFLDNDPAIRDQSAAGIIMFAMVGAFPCPK